VEQGGQPAQRSMDRGRALGAGESLWEGPPGASGADARAQRARVLYVADHPSKSHIVDYLRAAHLDVETAACGAPAIEALESDLYDLVFLCACKPGPDGLFVLARGRGVQPTAQFIILTDDQNPDTAVEAMRLGAFDYLTEPVDPSLLTVSVERALERTAMSRLMARLQRGARDHGCCHMVGDSAPMHRVYDLIERVAGTNATVLVTGETGTGKELVARGVHTLSDRSQRPFVPISCAALPSTLLESELFGHRRGSFTGAVANRRGLFEDATGGTAFLDDVETLGPDLQAKLLRVLQERTIQPVGGHHDIAVDVRIVAATNVELETLVEAGTFRRDLYYRLNVFPIRVPPLRERRADIPALAIHFRNLYAAELNVPAPSFGAQLLEALMAYDWPGNVRELEHWAERSVIMALGGGQVDAPPSHGLAGNGLPSLAEYARLGWSLERIANEYIKTVLDHTEGHRGRAADLLGIDRRTLYRKARRPKRPRDSRRGERSPNTT